jgi:hypothetical protein
MPFLAMGDAPTRALRPAIKVWLVLVGAILVALAIYPFQPFTGSFALVLFLVLMAMMVVLAALAIAKAT